MTQHDTLEMTRERAPLVLERYRLVRRLGSGGFGTVWQAHDERLDRPVAIKRIPLDEGENPRAEREALAAARLSHPAIVALYEAGRDDEAWWLVSELVHGRTLGDLEREGALSDRDVVRIGATLCDALAHAHARGVVHRDVKPGNVMVADDGSAKLTDFGIARLLDNTGALTRTGDVIGTIAYMAPEQAEGRRVTEAADLYALALVLFEALSGTNPVRADGAGATARRVGMRLPALGRLRRDLPGGLCEAIDAALDPDPDVRGTVADLHDALADAERVVDDEPGHVTPPTAATLAERTAALRHRLAPLPPPAREPPAHRHGDEDDAPRLRPAAAEPPPAPHPGDPRRGRLAGPRLTLPKRLFAGAAAAGLAFWACERLPVDLTLAGAVDAPGSLAVAAGVGAATVVLPRLAWLLALVALCVVLGAERITVVVLAAAVPVVVLTARHGHLWSLPAGAALLDAAGIAGAYPALAGQAATLPARAALGALGLWWLELGAIVGERRPDLAVPADPGVLALAALWATAAALLPLLVRGRSAAVDALGGAVWAAALAAATPAVAEAFAATAPAHAAPAAALGGGLAVVAAAVRRRPST